MKALWKKLAVLGGAVAGLGALAFVGSYLSHEGQYLVPATSVDNPALPSRSIDGYRFHFEIFGLPTQPAVIVLHGGPGGDYRSLLLLQALSDDYQVVFYDQRGSGLSPRVPDEQLTFERHLEDLHAIVNVVSPHRPVRLVGHDFGAMLAAAYLERHPENVSHAVLAEPGYLTREHASEWRPVVGTQPSLASWAGALGVWRSLMQSLHVYGPDEDAREDYLALAIANLDVPRHPLGAYYCGGDRRTAYWPTWRVGARAAKALLADLSDGSGQVAVDLVSPNVKRFPHKVLVMAGSCNGVSGAAAQRRNLELFGHAELAVVEDAGHTLFGEQPEASLAVLRRYLGEDHMAIVASD